MVDRPVPPPPDVDLGDLGKTMLAAAHAARIGVTVAVFEDRGPRNIYVSEAAADILGWTPEELVAGDPMMHVAPEDLARLRERARSRAEGERGEASYEFVAIRKDGRRVHVSLTTADGTVNGRRAVVGFVVDITARKAADESRRRNEARFRELIEKAPEPIGIIRNDHFVYANPAYVATLRYPSAAALYQVSLSSLVDPQDAAHLETRVAQLMDQDGDRRDPERLAPYTYKGKRHDGTTVLLETSSVPFEYEGALSILTMSRDVTERQLLQDRLVQADRLAALGTMAAGVAHEINNPLAYVMLNLDWIARKFSEGARDPSNMEALAEMLHEARRGAERVATIVHELRSFSRAEGETRRKVDLAAVVQATIKLAAHEIRPRARIVTSFEPTRPVWANEGRLEQVVLNLLLNAAHALPDARIESNELFVGVRADGDHRVVLEVADNGVGIAPEVVSRIFDPFFTTKAPAGGTGLGLSICHGIVSSLGGQITVHSVPGEGTTFRVVLPAMDIAREAEPPPPSTESGVRPAAVSGRARILVIDDEVQIANTLRELLAPDHDVVATTDAREGLSAIEAGRDFDVIFCDLMMPGMTGIDFYEKLRTRGGGVERRIVFMTGGAFTTRAAEFLASVENRRLEKPFSLQLVERIVREMKRPR
jgi:PAS domain S-box-containing protein